MSRCGNRIPTPGALLTLFATDAMPVKLDHTDTGIMRCLDDDEWHSTEPLWMAFCNRAAELGYDSFRARLNKLEDRGLVEQERRGHDFYWRRVRKEETP